MNGSDVLSSKYKAFLFDLNGTMIDDMQYHIHAWHSILNNMGANISLEQVKQECYGKNVELLERIFPGRFTDDEKARMGYEKELGYQRQYRPQLQLLPGLENFLKCLRLKDRKIAIGSAALLFNINFVLEGLNISNYFDAIVSADDVAYSKPHPETFLKCAAHLQVAAHECIVFEDTPKGVEAAQNAGMDCVVITTMHEPGEFHQYANIITFTSDYESFIFI